MFCGFGQDSSFPQLQRQETSKHPRVSPDHPFPLLNSWHSYRPYAALVSHDRLTTRSIAMPCQLFVWLRHRIMGTDRQRARPRESVNLPPAHASTHAPVHSHQQNDLPPPSYDNLFPSHPDGTEDLETVRARHPPKRPLQAPMPTDSPIEAAYLASVTAATGYVAAAQDETHPCMIAARIAQAISIAASASGSHAALLAALSTVELR